MDSEGLSIGPEFVQVPAPIRTGALGHLTDELLPSSTPNRYLAGEIEVLLKNYVSDKTSWQKMLKNDIKYADLTVMKQTLSEYLTDDLKQYIDPDDTIHEFIYPVIDYPLKVKSVNFDKQPEVEGRLWGFKGQYLIFDDGRVFNVRRHNGYLTTLEV